MNRIEGRVKVTGLATYAAEYPAENVAYAYAVQAQIAKGRVKRVDAAAALELPGVLAVLSCEAAPRLPEDADPELALFQRREVAYRGQIVAAVVADTYEIARDAAAHVRVDYDADDHDVRLSGDHPGLYQPEVVNPNFPSDTDKGDVEAGLAAAATTVDVTYETPVLHNNPMEPHAALALWDTEGRLLVYDTAQGTSGSRDTIAKTLGLPPEQVRVVSRHVGGGFGSKGTTRPQAILAALASRMVGRPVKIALTRQQMFDVTGYRTPTIQRLRLGVDGDGRLTALEHLAYEQSSTLVEFAEQTATPTRVMYASPALRTGHRLVRLDVATPSWMRAPGECPGMYALESAMDELACAAGLDPVELRIRNEPETEPFSGVPFSSRNLVGCLREGAHRFGWRHRDPRPGVTREGEWLVGTGVAASTYPARRSPCQAVATMRDGDVLVQVAAADIGTGARTALTRIAANALGIAPERVHVELGDSDLPRAPVAGGSAGTASWGTAVVRACEELRRDGKEGRADTTDEVKADAELARHAFGAQFAEVRVSAVTGEVRVSRLLGVFAAGHIVDEKLARSQFLGGMTMGLGMALMEETLTDEEFGGFLHRDLAQYHVPACADAQHVEAVWLEEEDGELNPMGSKGIGEIGIVGTAAAIGNAVHHATGHRFRELPITPAKILTARF
ncbi:Periplasmic aromatic aldehyde oxidoreductase, molybdenum binding subunit YagR [[Actinomadura] parvosata subsp. kistnae]|uniref:Xanthine dehydrogenase n=1 Tax=[Actinomadura] parvosata subsp. kistnae TaxID=1909395 RepID=A0A1V0A2C4_9ACTN|nr:xanthine dehydrogenase family protein molybdopterin-binding subunit [Nonomuraea sp. ATCC 55076]AQZ64360.1 xanthine dehydrogenase [Nonomuraea sp. ATCC 55076]SPL89133.1 Periplasmic aromatic aldehyde oxidoreductase, molybdenum binding subunit YagR [Actinomadura parvosata subsp. kistnae]